MIKKILLAVFFAIIVLLLKPSLVNACEWVDAPISECNNYAPAKQELCCHTKSGCSSGCGFIPWYGWCHISGCRKLV